MAPPEQQQTPEVAPPLSLGGAKSGASTGAGEVPPLGTSYGKGTPLLSTVKKGPKQPSLVNMSHVT